MKNDKLFKKLDKFNQRRAINLYKAFKNELKELPPSKERDDIIAYNLAMLITWGDIPV